MGLVQPATAALYDFYNPGEDLGDTWEVWGRCPHTGHQDLGQCRMAGMSCGSLGLRKQWRGAEGGCILTALFLLQSTNALSSMGRPLRANSCPHCALLTSASVLRVRARAWGRGWEDGEARGYAVSWGGLLSPGKCPRQRRALERGLQEEVGYRMKFACYYPRVQYGQSSLAPKASLPGPAPLGCRWANPLELPRRLPG